MTLPSLEEIIGDDIFPDPPILSDDDLKEIFPDHLIKKPKDLIEKKEGSWLK